MARAGTPGTTEQRRFVRGLRKALAAAGNADDAVAMQAYMKSEMPYHGVKKAAQKSVLRALLAEHPKLSWEQASSLAQALWRSATHREERYAAIALTGLTRHRKDRVLSELHLFEEMIVTGAWWDYVDEIATHRLTDIVENEESSKKSKRRKRNPALVVMRRWARDENVWRRRSAILCQLLRKERTDTDLLEYALTQNLHRKEFWIRKAVGWALRHYARTNERWVRAFVETNEDTMAPLSKREAMKNLR